MTRRHTSAEWAYQRRPTPRLLRDRHHYAQATLREKNQAYQLTCLNAAMARRNRSIDAFRRQVDAQQKEIERLIVLCSRDRPRKPDSSMSNSKRTAEQPRSEQQAGQQAGRPKVHKNLGLWIEMTVALHQICTRQQDFLAAISGNFYANDGRERAKFNAWVQSNRLYLAHAQGQVIAETNWEDAVERANIETVRQIAKAAQHAARYPASQQARDHAKPAAQQPTEEETDVKEEFVLSAE